MGGKLIVEGCNTPEEENKVLKTTAQKSVIKYRAYCKTKKFVKVKFKGGYFDVEKEKYEANKGKYEKLRNT
jgi:hypothetical protein